MSSTSNGGAATVERWRGLLLAALGVVFGDIGTSPLYALRQCLTEYGEPDEAAVFGILSLIAWALILVVTVKYVVVVLRADNRGEGGILAVMALAQRLSRGPVWEKGGIVIAGMCGVALFFGDAMITPAISVLSAIEGLEIAAPGLEPFVLPISLALLIALFSVQSYGTARVGASFGPIIVVWFLVLAVLGVLQIVASPRILLALSPTYGFALFLDAPLATFALLGAVFLAVTGAEALYADMGHFGRGPVRVAWLYLVLPALLLNYLGQGALVLRDPTAIENPFYHMAPEWARYPLVVLAAMATVIASQAVITGAYSVTRQAVQLGLLPRLEVRHTSAEERGQIYMPWVNYALLVSVIGLVLGFRSSESLGYAYGIAVSGTMLLTTVLTVPCLGAITGWRLSGVVALTSLFLLVDLAFLGSNLLKFAHGGWFSILVALVVVVVMATWSRGRTNLLAARARDALPVASFLERLRPDHPIRVPGTGIFLTGRVDLVPNALLHTLKHYKVLHERVVLLTLQTEDEPTVPGDRRIEVTELGAGFYAISARFGFMEQPSVPRVLARCRNYGLRFELMETSFFVGHEKLWPAKRSQLSRWRQKLFILLSNNAVNATDFFGIPPNRAIEVGGHIEI